MKFHFIFIADVQKFPFHMNSNKKKSFFKGFNRICIALYEKNKHRFYI